MLIQVQRGELAVDWDHSPWSGRRFPFEVSFLFGRYFSDGLHKMLSSGKKVQSETNLLIKSKGVNTDVVILVMEHQKMRHWKKKLMAAVRSGMAKKSLSYNVKGMPPCLAFAEWTK